MQIRNYYYKNFKDDLLGFLPDTRLPYFGHTWQHDCGNLNDVDSQSRAAFLICLYFTVLVDQTMHAHFIRDYPKFEKFTRYPKFCHGLAQFHKNPRDILYVPVKKGLVNRENIESLITHGMELFVDEVIEFLQDHMSHIKPEAFFEKLIYDPDVQIPLIFVLADNSLKEDIVFKAYEELKKAVKKHISEYKLKRPKSRGKFMNTNTLKKCYDGLKEIVGEDIESFEIVNEVENYRQFWKPKKGVKVVLLAESHIFTEEKEFKCQLKSSNLNLDGYPKNYVRFVYCLAYGENDLLENDSCVNKNRGSSQFWKDLYSCVFKIEANDDFDPVLKKGTPNFSKRINNKIKLLRTLQECGIWLVDASIIGLYRSNAYGTADYQRLKNEVISSCWHTHTKHELKKADPNFIICIGKDVEGLLEKHLNKEPFKGRFDSIPQPQARRDSISICKAFEKYFTLCKKFCRYNWKKFYVLLIKVIVTLLVFYGLIYSMT